MKTLTLYTKEEIEERWPSVEFEAQGFNGPVKIVAHRITFEAMFRFDAEAIGLEDGGQWRIAVDSRGGFQPSSIPAILEALAKIQLHIEKYP